MNAFCKNSKYALQEFVSAFNENSKALEIDEGFYTIRQNVEELKKTIGSGLAIILYVLQR